MATDQAFLDGLRAQAGMGMGNYTRPSAARSNDQNNTISGNPGGISTPVRFDQQQQAANSQAYQGSVAQQAAIRNAAMRQAMSGQYNGFGNPMQQLFGYSGGMPQQFNQPGLYGQAQTAMQPTQFVRPMGSPVPDQLAQRNVVGSRYVRPMVR